jgi:hypothetical protein
MADIDELFGPGAWGPILDELRRGEDPHLADIAQALRGNQPPPTEVRCYIADVLEKKIHRKTGPKKNEIKKFRDLFLKVQVEHWKEVHKRAKRRGIKIRGGAYEVARERVSKRTGLSEGTIDKICYPRNKKRINAQ